MQGFGRRIAGLPYGFKTLSIALLFGSLAAAGSGFAQNDSSKCPPPARVDDVKDTYGSTVVADPYRWLEDQKSPETRAWIDAEQKCTEAALSGLPGRQEITKRLSALLRTDSFQLPHERGGRYFFLKRKAEEDLSKLYVRRKVEGEDELLVDPLPWSKDHSTSVTLEEVSQDGRLVFYGKREGGQDEVTVHAMEVDTKKEIPDVLPSADYFGVALTPDNKEVYYSRTTPDGPRVFRHVMGSNVSSDKIVFGDGFTKDKIVAVQMSEDGRYLVYLVLFGSGSEQSEIFVQDLEKHTPVVPAVSGIKALFYPRIAGDRLYILTNWNAPQWHIYSTNLAAPEREHWTEAVAEGKEHIEDFRPAGGKLVVQYTRDASSELKIFDANGKNGRDVQLPALGSVSGISGRWESPEYFFTFETFDVPDTILRYDGKTGKTSVWAQPRVPIDVSAFEVEQVWYTSKDKTRIPMFLFHRKGLKKDGANPVLLTGYGGFDVSETPNYSAFFLVWAEHGGIVAKANLRGGGEFGEEWHRAGMLEKKQNVFDDFESAAEYLIQNKYTNPDKLAIYGNSNGGLLVGAALTQRPDLFRAVVCGYPLLDMLRYQKFLDGPYWVPEYGSADNPAQFPYLYAYSPYQNVKKGTKYPATLFVSGDGDTRVAPLHARKMTAELQAANGSDRPILLLYDTKSGHSGGRPVNKIIEENTDVLSFLFWQLGVKLAPAN
jgi:prolyl oligopeptidase